MGGGRHPQSKPMDPWIQVTSEGVYACDIMWYELGGIHIFSESIVINYSSKKERVVSKILKRCF